LSRNYNGPRRRRWEKKKKPFWAFSSRHSIIPLLVLVALALVKFLPPAPETQGRVSPPAAVKTVPTAPRASPLTCHSPYIIDGDTFDCAGKRIRLSGIDAPEMPDHCRPGRKCTAGDPFKSRDYLQSISRGPVSCSVIEVDVYGRFIAECQAGEFDLSCAMVASGNAVRRYRPLNCK
jgi:endonuclease YncB( thermonuclease family)